MSETVKEVPWKFKTWLAKFIDVDLPIGDLSKDVARDTNFPDSEDYDTLYEYLENTGACQAALWTFDTTWKFYQETK